MKAKIETELQRQVDMGILEKVDTADWAAPIVPVTKPSGEIRLCGDYKVSINPQLDSPRNPICSTKWRNTIYKIRSFRSLPPDSVG